MENKIRNILQEFNKNNSPLKCTIEKCPTLDHLHMLVLENLSTGKRITAHISLQIIEQCVLSAEDQIKSIIEELRNALMAG